MTPFCPFCKKNAELVSGLTIYPHRPDLDAKKFWRCAPCGAYVGCHPGTENALGTLADAETRKERSATHAVFDPIWRNQQVVAGRLWRRGELYGWLATALGISIGECHIGHFSVTRCQAARKELARLGKHPDTEDSPIFDAAEYRKHIEKLSMAELRNALVREAELRHEHQERANRLALENARHHDPMRAGSAGDNQQPVVVSTNDPSETPQLPRQAD